MQPDAGLDAGFLIDGEDEFITAQGVVLPTALVEIQHAAGFLFEARVAGESPTAVLPGADRILVQPASDRRAADLGRDPAPGRFPVPGPGD